MPYSSSIQIVNDANGTAHAFLADNGRLWECQWNPEAQRWDQGQIVPGSEGSEGLEALYIDELWPNGQPSGAGGGASTNPGIVLAYRVGQGSSAEIFASLGAWGSDGQLIWAAPIPITSDGAEDQQFSLGDSGNGQFSLVVQKQLARDTSEQLLERAAALPAATAAGFEQKLQNLAVGTRPDQDLYQTTYSLQRTSSAGQPVINLTTSDGGLVGTITATEQPTAPKTAVGQPLFNGNTQLTRAAVFSSAINPQTKPATLGFSSLMAEAAPGGSALSGASAPGVSAGSFKGLLGIGTSTKGGIFSLGLSLFPARYLSIYQLVSKESNNSFIGSEGEELNSNRSSNRSYELTNSIEEYQPERDNIFVVQKARNSSETSKLMRESRNLSEKSKSFSASEALEEKLIRLSSVLSKESLAPRGPSAGLFSNFAYKNSPQRPVVIMTGLIGSTNTGAGSSVVNFSKFEIAKPKAKSESTALVGGFGVPGLAGVAPSTGEFKTKKGFTAAAVGGTLKSVFEYQAGLAQGQTTLKSYEARQSGGVSWIKRQTSPVLASAKSKSTVVVANSGFLFEQIYVPDQGNNNPLPQWLTNEGYGLAYEGYALNTLGVGYGLSPLNKVKTGTSEGRIVTAENGTTNGQIFGHNLTKPKTAIKPVFQGLIGLVNGFVVPATTDILMGKDYGRTSGGVGANLGLGGQYKILNSYGVGVEALASSQTSYLSTGNKGKFEELAYASAGAAAAFGIYVPLLQYHYNSNPASSSTSPPAPAATNSNLPTLPSANSSPQLSSGFYNAAPSGADYPLLYNPPHGSNSSLSNLSSSSASTFVLGTASSPLFLFSLKPGASTSSSASATRISIQRPGSGLIPTSAPVQVEILGTYIDPSDPSNRATASVTVNASGLLDSVVINNPGQYSYLPETGNNSGDYILQLDLAAAGLSTPSSTSPLVTLPASSSSFATNGLLTTPVLRISNQLIGANSFNLNASSDSSYPVYDSKTNTATSPSPTSLASYSYQNVPIQLYARNTDGSNGPLITLYNSSPSARVFFSGGGIKAIQPEQNLYFSINQNATSGYNILINFDAYGAQVNNPSLAALPLASISLPLAESVAYNNAVAEDQFSPQTGAVNAGVYLADGMSDAIPLFPEYGNQSVYNRVVHISKNKTTGETSRFFLNATNGNIYEPNYINQALNAKTELPAFSAASQPAALTIADAGKGIKDRFGGATFVAWVESTKPVVPLSTTNGEQNFQAFMQSLYGFQRINYRINQSISGWAPMDNNKIAQLYAPTNAVITQLRAFNAANPFTSDTNDQLSMLAWVEIPLPGETKQAASLKVAFINPTANDYSWNALTSNAAGQSTISSIPWQVNKHGEALSIDDLSIASMPLEIADGQGGSTVIQTPVLSFSRDVRTPYSQRVLNDSPVLYIPFNGVSAGQNDLNLGSSKGSSTQTFASSTGLDFSVAPALAKSQGTAVENTNGTGVLLSGLGSSNRPLRNLLDAVTPAELATVGAGQISVFTGSFSNRVLDVNDIVLTPAILSVSDLTVGVLAVGDTFTGQGITPGTRITRIIQAYDPSTKSGSYEVSADQTGVGTPISIRSYPDPTRIAYLTFEIDSVTNSSDPNTPSAILALSNLSGIPRVGDSIAGLGVTPATLITAVTASNLNSGTATITVNRSQNVAAATGAAVVAAPGSSSPYTIEFWAKLSPDANGGGLVAFAQPSTAAVGDVTLPEGWLLASSFVVDFISYKQAAARGLIDSIPDSVTNSADLYAWGWSVVADGANTTAMQGNGGNNIYSNGLWLDNLQAGNILDGVASFLQANGLKPDDLIGKSQSPAYLMASVPETELQFAHFIDPATGQPTSNLNTVAINSASAALNSGLVVLNPTNNPSTAASYPDWAQTITDPSKADQINALFQQLWAFQQNTGEAKVTFTQAPLAYRLLQQIHTTWPSLSLETIKAKLNDRTALAQFIAASGVFSTPAEAAQWLETKVSELNQTRSSSANPLTIDQFAGYELGYTLSYGPAVSLNAEGQIVFDVGAGSSAVSNLPAGLKDNQWHYIVASYLPDYVDYTAADSTTFQLPSNVGTATLYIDNKQASQSTVINAYAPSNVNDQLLLLANNAGASIDQLAVYDNALTAETLPPASANWPMPINQEALLALRELGMVIDTKTPDLGSIPGAVTSHWDGRTVNPNDAVINTFYSIFTPVPDGSQSGSWSDASTLNPTLAASPTTPSAIQPAAGRNSLVLAITPSLWSTNSWTTTSASQPTTQTGKTFNPSGLELDSVQVLINGSPVTLSPDRVLIGNTTLAKLQPNSSSTQLNYTLLSSAPALTLVPPFNLSSTKAITSAPTTATLVFSNGTSTSIALQSALISDASTQPLASAGRVAKLNGNPFLTAVETSNKALATSAIIEQAPLQLKYIDSGEVFRSTSSAASADATAASTPAQSFGYSQVNGSFDDSAGGPSSGWLAIAQPYTTQATSDPSGRVWIQYNGQFTTSATGDIRTAVTDVANAPKTWLNALAASNFSTDAPNRPLLNSAVNQSSSGGLLIQADPTAGIEQNFGFSMLSARVNGDAIDDLIIAAPQANGGGRVYLIDGAWIANNLTTANGATILNLANPDDLGDFVQVLTPARQTGADGKPVSTDVITVAGFGTALAYDETSNTLWIGAPNYLRNLGDPTTTDGLKAIGAIYSYSLPSNRNDWGSAKPLPLAPIVGMGGTLTSAGPDGTPVTSYWGSQFGSALAVSNGQLAVSAPGMVAGTLASGSQAATDTFVYGKKSDTSNSGIITGMQLPDLDSGAIDISKGINSRFFVASTSNTVEGAPLDFINRMRTLTSDSVADPTIYNNQAVQADAAGAVFYLSSTAALQSAPSLKTFASKGSVYYGPSTLNTLGATGFGSSIAFIDLNNTNAPSLAIGADASGGAGTVYLINPNASANNTPVTGLQPYQKLAANDAYLTLTGAASRDLFGNGLVNLGDVNQDSFDDLLIQAKNAANAAGVGYVLFGSDQFSSQPGQSVTGTVAPGSITQFTRADGSPFQQAILVQQGYASGFTGAGSFGRGDIDADGINDIQLGSGPNGNAYLTWGHPYLEAISNLSLSKLASNTGYLLDGLATTTEGSLRSIGDFNADGYGDYISVQPGDTLTTVRIELGADTQTVLADYLYNNYSFSVRNGTQLIAAGDINGDGYADIALFDDQNLSSAAQGNQGAGSTTGILYGRSSADLPVGSGFGLLTPVDPSTGAPLAPLPGLIVEGGNQLKGLTSATPALIADGNTLYAAVKGGSDNTIWFNSSSDGGATWNNWTNLSAIDSAFQAANGAGPSLALHNGRLYLGFVNQGGSLLLSSWSPASGNSSLWTQPALLSTTTTSTASFSSAYSPQLIDRGDALGILWVDPASGTLFAADSTDPNSTNAPNPALDNSWSAPRQLLQRSIETDGQVSFNGIAASSAPVASWLGDHPLIAVNKTLNNSSSINVYSVGSTAQSWTLASSFSTPTISANAPGLTTTATGLALTYTNTDRSITVNQLAVLNPNGTPVDGLQFNPDGSLSISPGQTTQTTDLQWSSSTLTAANSGISSELSSTPVSLNGTLLLANVRPVASDQSTQLWLNALPAANDPDSTTWLNTTLQLRDEAGNWLVQQQGGASHPVDLGVLDPGWQQPNDGLSPWAPSFAELDGVLYSAVRGWTSDGSNKQLYWNRSFDGGATWSQWLQLSDGFTSDRPPTIAAYDGTLYLVYIGQDKAQTLNITALLNADTNQWASQFPVRAGISGASNQTAEFATLVNEGNQLALYYVGSGKNQLYSTSSSTPASINTFTTSTLIKYNNNSSIQTASGPLAAARLDGKTYLAYQGGTYQTGNNLPGKENQIFLTIGSANDTNWSLVNGVSQPGSASHTGVGLTANSAGLVLSYSDVVDGLNTVSLQQGTGSGSSWTFSPYTVLERPADSQALYDGANSLFSRTSSEQVLVSTINPGANEAIVNATVSPLPPTLNLSPKQTRSTLTPVGDITGDGLADLLITAANVVRSGSAGSSPQLQTGVRLFSGAATSDGLLSVNNANATSQTLQLAPALPLNADAVSTSLTAAGVLGALPQFSLIGRNGDVVSQISSGQSNQTLANFNANASDPASLLSLFQNADQRQQTLHQSNGWGQPALNSSGFYGDLNGDGRLDLFDPVGNNAIAASQGSGFYSLWSIRAAGDVNGNGVDDVVLTVSPNGPAYGQLVTDQPSALQSVLVDGSLFKVDPTTNSFRLDQLRTPLNPYNRSQLYDINSTTNDVYLPALQNWFDPLLTFQPGQLTAASTTNPINPVSAKSYSPPSAVVSPQGQTYLFFSGADNNITGDPSGLWMAYKDNIGSWQQLALPAGSSCNNTTPSAVYYKGKLYVAYTDTDQNINIAVCTGSPQNTNNWSSYKVVSTSSESTMYSPTLVVEDDRLAMYFPSNNDPGFAASVNTTYQYIRYLYSLDPANKSANGNYGNWGASLDTTTGQYTGISGQLDYEVTSPIAATTFLGRTVLAFRGYDTGFGLNAGNGNIQLLTGTATAPSPANPSPSLSWGYYDTGFNNVNGVGLATDQALLYLTTAKIWGDKNPSSGIWSLSPNDLAAGSWSMDSQQTLKGPSLYNETFAYGTFSGNDEYFNATVVPFMANGSLMAAWSDHATNVQIADLSATVTSPSQQSLAGFSLDANLDVNGDGFMDVLLSDPSDPSQSVDNQYALFGGDYLDLATQVGTSGDDNIIGTPLADVLYTLSGADRIQSLGGFDVILSGAGDDQISIINNAFIRIDAGGGFDQLLLEGNANQSYDFTLNTPDPQYFAGTKLRNIELISSIDYGSNTISLDTAAVNAFNTARILFLTPDSNDHIALSSDFQRNSSFDSSYGGVVWSAYSANSPSAPSTSSPSLVYVLNPDSDPVTADAWLGINVTTASAPATSLRVAAPAKPDTLSQLPRTSPIVGNSQFGDGLNLVAYRSDFASGVASFSISRTDVSRSQVISYVSSTINSSAEPGSHYRPVAGLVRLDVGQAQADITVPIYADAISALRNATVSLEVAEHADQGQEEINLLLDAAPSPTGKRPVFSGLNLEVDPSGTLSSIVFRADITKVASSLGLASTFNLNVLRRTSAYGSASDSNNRIQKLVLSEGALAKFDRDGTNNGQVELQLDLNATMGSIQLKAANLSSNPLVLSKLDPSKKSNTLGIDISTTPLDALSLATTPATGVLLNKTAVDFTVEADADGKAKIFLDLTQVAGDLEITETRVGGKATRKPNHQLLYYGIDDDGALSALTYNARRRAGARFYDTDGDDIADFVSLTFVDGGFGDTGPSGDGLIHDPSVGGVSNLTDVEWKAIDSRTLQAASRTNKDAPAALVVKVGLNNRSTSANQICYVVHDPSDSLSFDSIFADLDLLKARSQTLYTSLESTDVTLASSTSLSREILLINGQSVRFFEVVDGTLNTLTSANDALLRVLSTTGFSGDSRSVNAFSSSGVSLSLALVDGDQVLNALIGQEQGIAAVLDFTSFATDQKVEGSLSLAREAAFDAVTGFYRTLDIKGSVWLDPLDKSKGTIAPGQTGTTAADYGAAALRSMVDSLTGMRVDNRQTSSRLISLQESTYLAPIAQVNGHTFVSFDKGNTDGISHFVTLGTNTFGLEDLHGGGDKDYDDQIISLVFSKLVNPVV